ncbi:MAG: hypothetical protein ACI3U2_00255 [Anaerovibrio sp.]
MGQKNRWQFHKKDLTRVVIYANITKVIEAEVATSHLLVQISRVYIRFFGRGGFVPPLFLFWAAAAAMAAVWKYLQGGVFS